MAHLWLTHLRKMLIFYSYASVPEANHHSSHSEVIQIRPVDIGPNLGSPSIEWFIQKIDLNLWPPKSAALTRTQMEVS